ncbi:MAG: hypothetical protein F6K09_10315 [Merismopedia sp. SIO2A8]|nr:hypothetical protein [Merismopedia sp. SIO2A8]
MGSLHEWHIWEEGDRHPLHFVDSEVDSRLKRRITFGVFLSDGWQEVEAIS